jgi:hypothetical protein
MRARSARHAELPRKLARNGVPQALPKLRNLFAHYLSKDGNATTRAGAGQAGTGMPHSGT